MEFVPLIRVGLLVPIMAFLDGIGAPVARLLEDVGVPADIAEDPEGLMPLWLAMRFLGRAARSEGIQDLGLRAGCATPIEAFGAVGRIIRRSLTLGAALDAACRLGPTLNSGERSWLEVRGEDACFCHVYRLGPCEGYWQAEQYWFALALQVLRFATGPSWEPTELHVQSRMPGRGRPRSLLTNVRMVWGQSAARFAFPRSFLELPLPEPDRVPEVRESDLHRWNQSAPASDLAGSLQQVVEALSDDPRPRIAAIAEAIGMSVRSLQRQLAARGASYDRLVDESNRARAVDMLRGDAKIIHVALAMGYSDPAHFTRAFRRWTGSSPRDFRRRTLTDAR